MSTKTLGRWAVGLALGIAIALGATFGGSAALSKSGHSHALADVTWQMMPLQWADENVAQ